MTVGIPEARRQARSIRNDERILDAATEIAAADGWAGLLPARVAERSGLSHPAVSARFADRSQIGASVWRQRLADPVIAGLQAVLVAAGLLYIGEVDQQALARALRVFVEPDESMRAAAELLVVSTFDGPVHEAVRATLGVQLDEWLTPVPQHLSEADAARRAFLVILALGSLLEVRREDHRPVALESEWERIGTALGAPDATVTVPEVHFDHWDGVFDFDTGDPLLDRLLEATRDEIGRNGYDATTIDDIARAAGRTKGLVFSRYPSKKQLFNDTVTRYTKGMFDLNEQVFTELLADMSPGVTEALFYREFMRPGRERLHVFQLEQYRLAWHDDQMRRSVAATMADAVTARVESDPSRSREEWEAYNFVGAAQGVGTMLLAECCPGAWTLPYQHMTVPLND